MVEKERNVELLQQCHAKVLKILKPTVQSKLSVYKTLECKLNLQVYFLHNCIDHLPENLGSYSEKQSEIHHQDVCDIKRHYQRLWDVNALVDYCWILKRVGKHHRQEKVSPDKISRIYISQFYFNYC
ncbi:uncharacterized protein TNIN_245641 [Trichonephila inaurata madagascariensis]|uniref:Uncharacterized protein n=1 Tax=Trichonephila inaurata madagascariensis TaxID=2747483 RepID=A0A8X7C5S8_9ARAC|nr:uncharacterized protein TNIN_245641 [Trichonephila inaurata madagascariensis]